jgi:hypothetical protein
MPLQTVNVSHVPDLLGEPRGNRAGNKTWPVVIKGECYWMKLFAKGRRVYLANEIVGTTFAQSADLPVLDLPRILDLSTITPENFRESTGLELEKFEPYGWLTPDAGTSLSPGDARQVISLWLDADKGFPTAVLCSLIGSRDDPTFARSPSGRITLLDFDAAFYRGDWLDPSWDWEDYRWSGQTPWLSAISAEFNYNQADARAKIENSVIRLRDAFVSCRDDMAISLQIVKVGTQQAYDMIEALGARIGSEAFVEHTMNLLDDLHSRFNPK